MKVAMQSLYETLEVSTHASSFVIRAAYRSLVQHHHPDRHGSSEIAGQRLAAINCAYAVLSDPQKRHDYDLLQGIASNFVERRQEGTFFPVGRRSTGTESSTCRPFGFRPLA
jgi:DnaJ-class molecular chaperone